MGRRKGRSRKSGPREASGRLQRHKAEGISPALVGRIKNWIVKLLGDSKWASRVGELSWIGELTNAQTAAAFRVGEIYRRYHRFQGLRTSAKSASLEQGFGSAEVAQERMGYDELERLEAAERAARDAWAVVDDELTRVPRNVRQAMLDVCVFDTAINPMLYNDIRISLDRLTQRWGEGWKRQKVVRLPTALRSLSKTAVVQVAAPKRGRVIRWDHLTKTVEDYTRALRPDLDADGLDKAKETFLALADRVELKERSANVELLTNRRNIGINVINRN